jgi:predicted RNA binding protein YcfA (HicA-like mRNA interferase family)
MRVAHVGSHKQLKHPVKPGRVTVCIRIVSRILA